VGPQSLHRQLTLFGTTDVESMPDVIAGDIAAHVFPRTTLEQIAGATDPKVRLRRVLAARMRAERRMMRARRQREPKVSFTRTDVMGPFSDQVADDP
jgi:hypothetical protein